MTGFLSGGEQRIGAISVLNSSYTALGAGGVFTGQAEKIDQFGTILVTVRSDQSSATDGLKVEFSPDSTNWDANDVYTVPANSGKTYSFQCANQYYRIVYTNGVTPQTFLRLQTTLKQVYVKPSSHRIKDDIIDDDDAELQIAVLKVPTNDLNTFKNVDLLNPLPTDGDSVYGKDIDLANTVTTDWTGDVSDLFGDISQGMVNSTANNPKELLIRFRRSIVTNAMGLGAETGNFSNVKIIAVLSGGAEVTLFDNSSDNTDKTSQTIQFFPVGFLGLKIQFHTADTVNVTNVFILKSTSTVSVIQAQKTDGTVVNVGATDSANLKVSDAENGLAIAAGDVVGTSFIHKFGNAPDFDDGDGVVTIWDGADDGGIDEMQYNYSTSAIIDSISSSAGGDTQDIEIQGLDSNYDLITQTITLTAQTRKALDTNLIRVFRLKNVGSTDLAGTVYCYENTALSTGVPIDTTKVRALIHIGNNQTLMSVFTIPNGTTGYMRDWYAALSGANRISNYVIDLFARPFGQVFQLKHKSAISETGSSQIQHKYEEPEVFAAKTDIEMRASLAESPITAAAISAGFDIVLKDN